MSEVEASTATIMPPPRPKKWTGARIAGLAVMVFWAAAGVGLVWYLIDAFSIKFYERYAWKFLHGFWITIKIVGISLIIGAVLSVPLTFARLSSHKVISKLAFGYSYLFRGTPLLAQTYLVYYGFGAFSEELKSVGLWWFFRDATSCIIFIFSLNTAAYQAEILRGSIENVPNTQTEAGRALGLSTFAIYYKIIIPQALITALRPYGNEIILMIKGSAIASLVTVFDLMGETRRAFSRSFDFQTYIWAALLYLSVVEALRNVWSRLETRLTRHLERESE